MAPLPLPPNPQKSVTYEDVAVYFTTKEWASLTPAQKSLYREIILENSMHIAFLGYISKLRRYIQLAERIARAMPANAPPSSEH